MTWRFAILGFAMSWASAVMAQQDMTFGFVGPLECPTCWHIVAEGRIVPSSPAQIAAHARAPFFDGMQIYLNSEGGDTAAARALGEIFRRHRVTTIIGWGQSCMGACLLAFAGGAERLIAGFPAPDAIIRHQRTGLPAVTDRVPATLGVWRSAAAPGATLNDEGLRRMRAYLLRMGVDLALGDLFTLGPAAPESAATVYRLDIDQMHALRLPTMGRPRHTWILRRVGSTMHAMTTQLDSDHHRVAGVGRGVVAIAASLYRDRTGIVWLRLWPRTAGDPDLRAEFDWFRRHVEFIRTQAAAPGDISYPNFPQNERGRLVFGSEGDQPWVDIWLSEDAGARLARADQIRVRPRYALRPRSPISLSFLDFSLVGGHETIAEALGPAPVR